MTFLTIGLTSCLCPKNRGMKLKANAGATGGDRTHGPWLLRAEKLLDVNCFKIPEIVVKPHKYSLLIVL